MANIITVFRVVCSVLLLFTPNFSVNFYATYITAGMSDMLDGFVARKTKTTSEFGAKLDSIADVIFVAVCLMKFLPTLQIQIWLWIWIAGIASIKLINVIAGILSHKKIILPHKTANKITGLLLFIAPLFMNWISFTYLAVLLCVIATFAAIQEG